MLRQSEEEPRTSNSCLAWVVPCLLVLTYAATSSQEFSGDMFHYVRQARDGGDLFHPHHVLYLSNLRVFVRGLPLDPLAAASLSSIIWSAVGLYSLSLLTRRATGSALLAALSPALLGLLRLYWGYSNRPEVYVPSGACVLLSFALAPAPRMSEGGSSWPRWLASGAALAAGCLLNQAAVLAAPGLLLVGLFQGSKRALRGATLAVAGAGVISMGTYVLVYVTRGGGESFWTWLTRYAHVGVASVILAPFWSRRARTGLEPVIWGMLTWLVLDFSFHVWWVPHEHEQFILCSISAGALITLSLLSMVNVVGPSRVPRLIVGLATIVPIGVLLIGSNWRTNIRGLVHPPVSHRTRIEEIAQGVRGSDRYVLPGDWYAGYVFAQGEDSLVVSGYRVVEDFDEVEGWLGRGGALHVHEVWLNVPYGYRSRLNRDRRLMARYWEAFCGCAGSREGCGMDVRLWTIKDVAVGVTFIRSDTLPVVSVQDVIGKVVDLCRHARLRHDGAQAFLDMTRG